MSSAMFNLLTVSCIPSP